MPNLRHSFFSAVGHNPNFFDTTVSGKWKCFAKISWEIPDEMLLVADSRLSAPLCCIFGTLLCVESFGPESGVNFDKEEDVVRDPGCEGGVTDGERRD
mmetsp:Transcript_45589/g.91257  ORF Transcript_45589/g.91257 Transcript_45589/m.91257 type:complete len:98 (+) Transcript_45589:832-1125(+)